MRKIFLNVRRQIMNRKTHLAILTFAATASQLLYADNDVYDNTTVTENFINASLVDSSWYKTIASGVQFTGSNLTNANFNSATLNDTDFTDTNLTNANFRGYRFYRYKSDKRQFQRGDAHRRRP